MPVSNDGASGILLQVTSWGLGVGVSHRLVNLSISDLADVVSRFDVSVVVFTDGKVSLPRFCFSNTVSNGSTYFDLLVHVWHIINESTVVVYGPTLVSIQLAAK